MNRGGAPEVGAVFGGDFRIVKPLAQGGMGAVYAAEQISTGQIRALKVMQASLVRDERLRERFAREARIGSQIDSEHVVSVIAAGVDAPSGMPWLAMELLQGEELGDHLERVGSLPPTTVADLFEQLGHALARAHDAGIVHRDLKPENVFLARSRRADGAFTVKLLDFGIARFTNEAQGRATGAMGTPFWMAPEQTEASSNVGPPADVWALGLIAFRALTGRIFWKAATHAEVSMPSILAEILFDPLPAASARARALGAAFVPGAELDAWFAATVARDPRARYATGREAIDALVGLLRRGNALVDAAGLVDDATAATQIGPSVSTHAAVPLPMAQPPSPGVGAPSAIAPAPTTFGAPLEAGPAAREVSPVVHLAAGGRLDTVEQAKIALLEREDRHRRTVAVLAVAGLFVVALVVILIRMFAFG